MVPNKLLNKNKGKEKKDEEEKENDGEQECGEENLSINNISLIKQPLNGNDLVHVNSANDITCYGIKRFKGSGEVFDSSLPSLSSSTSFDILKLSLVENLDYLFPLSRSPENKNNSITTATQSDKDNPEVISELENYTNNDSAASKRFFLK